LVTTDQLSNFRGWRALELHLEWRHAVADRVNSLSRQTTVGERPRHLAVCDAQKAEFADRGKKLAPLTNGADANFTSNPSPQKEYAMTSKQITIVQCAALSGLGSHEMMLGVTPTATHDSLHASYLLLLGRGWEAVRDMIIADIRASVDLGASKQAADLLIVLRRFLLERLRVAVVRCLYGPARSVSLRSSRAIRISQIGVRSRACGGVRTSTLNLRPNRRSSQIIQSVDAESLSTALAQDSNLDVSFLFCARGN
jgi:hypothetical protein